MFERFTDRARRVLVLAQEEARLLEQNFIGTEHLLLALISEGEGVAAKALANLDIALGPARARVRETVEPAGGSTAGSPPFTPRAKKVLELSLREALTLGHNYIGTEHMLLGLVGEGEGRGAQVLKDLGADPAELRRAVIQVLSSVSAEPTPAAGTTGEPPHCPHCRAGLARSAAYRVLDVPNDEGGETVKMIVMYCTDCGTALGTAS